MWHEGVRCHQLKISLLTGGLSNRIYLVEHTAPPEAGPASCILRRRLGSLSAMRSPLHEHVVGALLGERGLGPVILGYFEGGSLEQHIPGRNLRHEQLDDTEVLLEIARKMNEFHRTAHFPIPKKIRLFADMRSFAADMKHVVPQAPGQQECWAWLGQLDFGSEIDWLELYLTPLASARVLCHNDIQVGNIMQVHGRLHLIDFEYVCYGYREFDLGNFFCEMSMLNSDPEPPYFRHLPEKYPSLERRAQFAGAYLGVAASDPSALRLARAAQRFSLASHLLWSLWAVNMCNTPILFDYLEYARQRMQAYYSLKALVTAADKEE